jgi:hypothetical protein
VRVRAEAVLDETAALSAVWPEPGPGAISMELTAFLPDGSVRPLVWLRDYRSDWPSPLVFADPVPLPRGARLVLTTYLVNTTDAPVKAQPRVQLTRVPTAVNTF